PRLHGREPRRGAVGAEEGPARPRGRAGPGPRARPEPDRGPARPHRHRRRVPRRHRHRARPRRQPRHPGGPAVRGHDRRSASPGREAHRGVRAQHAWRAGRAGATAHDRGRLRARALRLGRPARAGPRALLPAARPDAAHRVRQHPEQCEPHPLGLARSPARLRSGSPSRPLPARAPSRSRLVAGPSRRPARAGRTPPRRTYCEETTGAVRRSPDSGHLPGAPRGTSLALHPDVANTARSVKPLVVVAALIAGVAALYLARGVLIPIALAVLIAFMLQPVVGLFMRGGLPRALSVGLAVTLLFAALGGVAWAITAELRLLSTGIPGYRDNLIAKIAHVRRLGRGGTIEKAQSAVTEVAKELQKETTAPRPRAAPTPVVVREEPTGLWQLPTLIEGLGGAATVLVLVIFMLI